jgi:hypothetical protein
MYSCITHLLVGHPLHPLHPLNLLLRGRANGSTRGRKQEVASADLAVGATRTLEGRSVSAREGAVRPGARLPRVARGGDGADQAGLGGADVVDGDVVAKGGRGAAEVEAEVAVLPGRVALHGQLAGVAVVDEALLEVLEGNAVADDVVGGRVVGDAELEAVAVALEGAEAPAVDAVAPGVDLLKGYCGGC